MSLRLPAPAAGQTQQRGRLPWSPQTRRYWSWCLRGQCQPGGWAVQLAGATGEERPQAEGRLHPEGQRRCQRREQGRQE